MKWLDELPTTNVRIGVTLILTVATAVRYLGWGVPVRMTANIAVLDGWGYWLVFLAAMAGLDVAQYLGKRFSDTSYAAAKSAGPSPVTVSGADTTVTAIADAAPIAATSPSALVVRGPIVAANTITPTEVARGVRDVHPSGEASDL
jgi:hypothetical protein